MKIPLIAEKFSQARDTCFPENIIKFWVNYTASHIVKRPNVCFLQFFPSPSPIPNILYIICLNYIYLKLETKQSITGLISAPPEILLPLLFFIPSTPHLQLALDLSITIHMMSRTTVILACKAMYPVMEDFDAWTRCSSLSYNINFLPILRSYLYCLHYT